MAIPTVRGVSSAKAEGTTTVAPGIPAGTVSGELMLACIAGANAGAMSVSAQGGGAWALLTNGGIDTNAGASTANAAVFYDYYNGTQTAPTFNTPGNHGVARIMTITGARSADGATFAGEGEATDVTADANMSTATNITTTDADCLIVGCFAAADDSPTFGATFTNASLASITNQVTDTTTQGNDSSLSVVTGTKAVAGSCGTYTNTLTGTIGVAVKFVAIRPPAATTTSGIWTPNPSRLRLRTR